MLRGKKAIPSYRQCAKSTMRLSILTPPPLTDCRPPLPSCRQCAKSTFRLSTLPPPLMPHCRIFIRENRSILQLTTVMILQLVVDSPSFHIDPPSLRTVDGPSTVRKIDNTTPYLLNYAIYFAFDIARNLTSFVKYLKSLKMFNSPTLHLLSKSLGNALMGKWVLMNLGLGILLVYSTEWYMKSTAVSSLRGTSGPGNRQKEVNKK